MAMAMTVMVIMMMMVIFIMVTKVMMMRYIVSSHDDAYAATSDENKCDGKVHKKKYNLWEHIDFGKISCMLTVVTMTIVEVIDVSLTSAFSIL